MDVNVQRRRESQLSMSMEEQLIHAVELRIAAEEEFKRQIVFSLKGLIQTLAECDPSNARTTLDLTQKQLAIIIAKLNDKRNIDSTQAQTIANVVKESNLFRGPTAPLPSPPPSSLPLPSALPPASPPSPPPSSLPPPSALPPASPLTSVVNPGGTPSNGQNMGLKPGRRGGRRTRRKGKSKRIV